MESDPFEWVDSIFMDKGESSKNAMPNYTIQKAPDRFRKLQPSGKNWYDPILVSIGPYHHGEPELQSVEELKSRFAREFMLGETRLAKEFCAEVLIKEVHELRKCYTEGSTNGYDDLSFTKMMFLDGCFILQFIDWTLFGRQERMMMEIHDIAIVQRDLFLLENQLPFKVLKALIGFKYTFYDETRIFEFILETRTGIRTRSRRELYSTTGDMVLEEHHHLLGGAWKLFTKRDDVSQRGYARYSRRSATDRSKVGISLRPSRAPEMNDVTFHTWWAHGRLTLPHLNIDETNITLLMNLVAYENTTAKPPAVANYICFLDSIIAHADDVKELKYAGILSNFLNSDEEAVKVIQEIATGLVPEDMKSYAEVKKNIERYHTHVGRTRIATWVSEVMRNYFQSPWTTIAVFYAVFAILLSCIQTYFTVFPRPDKH